MLFRSADDALRAAVLRRFAEVGPDGRPQRCEYCPPRKVLFGSQDAVTGAIRMLVELGHEPLRAYPCYASRIPGLEIWHYTRQVMGETITAEPEEAAADAP